MRAAPPAGRPYPPQDVQPPVRSQHAAQRRARPTLQLVVGGGQRAPAREPRVKVDERVASPYQRAGPVSGGYQPLVCPAPLAGLLVVGPLREEALPSTLLAYSPRSG